MIFGITVNNYLWKYSFYPKIFSVKIQPYSPSAFCYLVFSCGPPQVKFWWKIFLDENYIFRGSFLRWFRISYLFRIKISFWKSNRWNTSTIFTKMSTIDSSDSKSVRTDSDSDSDAIQFQPVPVSVLISSNRFRFRFQSVRTDSESRTGIGID